MSFADPWSSSTTHGSSTSTISSLHADATGSTDVRSLEFEDNFDPTVVANALNPQQPQDNRLPDSDDYLATLEKKLHRLRNNPAVLQQLAERREECMRSLLTGSSHFRSESELHLEESVNNSQLLRFLKPEQALSQAEIVRLLNHDHLQQETVSADEQENGREADESGSESSGSR